MEAKSILYVEDSTTQRQAMVGALAMRKFKVESAGTVAEARERLKQQGQQYDVVVLDMRLEGDPNHQGVSGAMLGIEFLATRPARRPEFIILSAYKELDYCELALKLGAAAYVSKGTTTHDDVIRHVRVLALRSAINPEQRTLQGVLEKIVATSQGRFDLLKRFCGEILTPQFDTCLGISFFFLLRDDKLAFSGRAAHSILTGGNVAELPEGPETIYDTLQSLAHGNTNGSEPFVFDKEKLPAPSGPLESMLMQQLDGAVLLPLSIANDLRLTIGLLPGSRDREDPKALARVMADYLRPTLSECLMRLILNSYVSQRTAKLRVSAEMNLYVGQEMQESLRQGSEKQELKRESDSFRRLATLANDLFEAGNILMALPQSLDAQRAKVQTPEDSDPYSLTELIGVMWSDLVEQSITQGTKLNIEGDCTIQVDSKDMELIIVRLLQWLALRQTVVNKESPPVIQVECRHTQGTAEIVFEDASPRLPKPLRQRLFEPFSLATPTPDDRDQLIGPGLYLALYLAKMLVEEKYGGQLLDCSDELPGTKGHRFVIRLPAVSEPFPE